MAEAFLESIFRGIASLVVFALIHPVSSIMVALAVYLGGAQGVGAVISQLLTFVVILLVVRWRFPRLYRRARRLLLVWKVKVLARKQLGRSFRDLRLDRQDTAFKKAPKISGIEVGGKK